MSNILVLGSGAREHAMCDILLESDKVSHVYVYPGNDGMIAENISRANIVNYRNSLLQFIKTNTIEMVVVGPEDLLVDGIYDFLNNNKIKCFGPSKDCARIEGSKSFSKNLMDRLSIPTAQYTILRNQNLIIDYINNRETIDFVLKYTGLAGGKGVLVSDSKREMIDWVNKLYCEKTNPEILLEKKLEGQEVSILGFCNGYEVRLMPQTQDYKKIYDGDKGLNTGGMGSHGPVFILSPDELKLVRQCMVRVVRHLNYKGILYAGIIKTIDGIYFLEFNCRFGDPEAQVILNLLDTDTCSLYDIFSDCLDGKVINVNWKNGYASNVVLSHTDYPIKKSDSDIKISINKKGLENKKIYWSNVKKIEKDLYTTGGRVLSLVNYSTNFYESFINIYNSVKFICYDDMYYRRDIGLNKTYILNETQSKPINIAILGSTRGTSSQLLIDSIKEGNVNASIKLVISNKKDAYILERARNNGLNYLYLSDKGITRKDYDNHLCNILRTFEIDLVILVGYMKIITKGFIDDYRGDIVNVHPSLLPKYGGLKDLCVYDEIIKNNDKVTGCTIHHVTEEVDRGRIILQRQLVNYPKDIKQLKHETQELESEAIVDVVKMWTKKPLNYKKSGVDIDEGNTLVTNIKDISKHIGGFCSELKLNNEIIGLCCDGVGTKIKIADKVDDYSTIGIDLVAMSVNDLIACGMRPLYFLDYIAIDKMDSYKCENIIRGIQEGCKLADCELVGGETAEMRGLYMKNQFDIAGFALGVKTIDIPDKTSICSGDLIYGLKSSGIHSNGFTLINKLLKRHSYNLQELLTPTKIYSEVFDIIQNNLEDFKGIAHITGGGFKDNISRILPSNLTFSLNEWIFPDVFKWVQEKSGMTRNEMLDTFNCGYGMVLILDKNTNIEGIDLIGVIR